MTDVQAAGHRAGGHPTTQGGARTALFGRHYCVCVRAMFIATRRASSFVRYDWGLAPVRTAPDTDWFSSLTRFRRPSRTRRQRLRSVPWRVRPKTSRVLRPRPDLRRPHPQLTHPKARGTAVKFQGQAELDFSLGAKVLVRRGIAAPTAKLSADANAA